MRRYSKNLTYSSVTHSLTSNQRQRNKKSHLLQICHHSSHPGHQKKIRIKKLPHRVQICLGYKKIKILQSFHNLTQGKLTQISNNSVLFTSIISSQKFA